MNLRTIILSMLLTVAFTIGSVSAGHEPECVPESANPEDINQVDVGDATFYIEERDSELGPVPGSGLFFGGGTWIYEESNGLPGMQRGGSGETVTDESCGHGPDTLIF